MTNLDSILKSRDITLPTKVRLVKAMVFPVVMYGCESWTVKKAEYRRIDAFKLWCWRRLFRVPWTARRSNQSILEEISLWVFFGRNDAKAETPILWPPHAKSWLIGKERLWCWEGLGAGGEGDDRGWDGWMASLTRWIWVWVNSGSWWWTGRPGVLQFMASQRVGHDWATELNWKFVFFGEWHFFPLIISMKFIQVLHITVVHSFLLLHFFIVYTTICLFILVNEHLVVSSFRCLWVMLRGIFPS